MENALFKISWPTDFHAQTAAEAAATLYARLQAVGKTSDDIARITIRTNGQCLRLIDKKGPLKNPADREHCIQYVTAVLLIFGRLTAGDYEDGVAADPRIDVLRAKTECVEDPQLNAGCCTPEKSSFANAVAVEFEDGSALPEVVVEYPLGHKRRRREATPLLEAKFRSNLESRFPPRQVRRILDISLDRLTLEAMPVNEYLDLYVI